MYFLYKVHHSLLCLGHVAAPQHYAWVILYIKITNKKHKNVKEKVLKPTKRTLVCTMRAKIRRQSMALFGLHLKHAYETTQFSPLCECPQMTAEML